MASAVAESRPPLEKHDRGTSFRTHVVGTLSSERGATAFRSGLVGGLTDGL